MNIDTVKIWLQKDVKELRCNLNERDKNQISK